VVGVFSLIHGGICMVGLGHIFCNCWTLKFVWPIQLQYPLAHNSKWPLVINHLQIIKVNESLPYRDGNNVLILCHVFNVFGVT
jgi:hypothetical protein